MSTNSESQVNTSTVEQHSGEQNSSARQPDLSNESKSVKQATYLGYLLFLMERGELSEGQELFVLKLQSKLNLDQIQHSMRLLVKLSKSPRAFARSRSDIERVKASCPSLPDKSYLREQRRIGVGYRDKGACRPSHRPTSEPPDLLWWSEDIAPALLKSPEEPRFITAEELYGKEHYNLLQELALKQLLVNSDVPFPSQ